MKKEQRKYLADKFGDLANLAIAALIFGQLATGKRLDMELTVSGGFIGVLLYVWGYTLVRSIRERS